MVDCWSFLCFPRFKSKVLITDDVIKKLQEAVSNDSERIVSPGQNSYKKDKSRFKSDMPPKVVVSPLTTEEVAAVAKVCHDNRIPMIAVGQQSGLEGGTVPFDENVVMINLMSMKKITHDAESMTATAEAGVLKSEFGKYLKPYGWFYAPDPSSDSSLGGQASTSGSGTTSVMYGTTRENILSMTVVLPDGRIIWRTRPPVRKTSTGYHLHQLFMGAEGTLGIITKIVVRILEEPKCISGGSIMYEKTKDAVECATRLVSNKLAVARLELVNKYGVIATNEMYKTNMEPHPHLFFEFHTNNQEDAKKQFEALRKLAIPPAASTSNDDGEKNVNGDSPTILFTLDAEEMEIIWKARRGAYFAGLNYRKIRWPANKPKQQLQLFSTDSCLPLPELARVVEATEEDFARTLKHRLDGIDLMIVAHIADGNFHCMIPMVASEEEIVEEFHDRLCYRVIEANGTVSGEHGIGIGKKKYLRAEHGDVAIDVMWQIKRALDPRNLMNVGKVLPP